MSHASCYRLHDLFRDKRNQRHDAGLFDGVGQDSLVLRAGPMPFWRVNFPLRIHKSADKISVLVIDLLYFALAKETGFFFGFYDGVIFVIHYILISHIMDRVSAFHAMGYALCD